MNYWSQESGLHLDQVDVQTVDRLPAGSMDTGSHHHVLWAIERGCFRVHQAAPFQELSTKPPAVGLESLKDEHSVVRKEERHHKAAHNKHIST